MRRNERGISLIVLVIAIVLMAVLVAVGVVLVLNKQDNKMEQEDLEELLTMSFSNSVKETPNEDIILNLTEEEKQNLNYEELTEDIISLEKGEGIVNAKLVEDETPLKWIYIGEGYTIEKGGGGDCIEYIFKSNEKTIYRYTKLVPLTEIN